MRKKYERYTKEKLEEIVKRNISVAGVMKELGFKFLNGGSFFHISNKIKKFGIDMSHFLGQRANSGERHRGAPKKRKIEEILLKRDGAFRKENASVLRYALLEIGRPYKCEGCGQGEEWKGHPLRLEIHHLNEDPLDNKRENLVFLCPNCHSQTDGFNKRKSFPKIAMEEGTRKTEKATIKIEKGTRKTREQTFCPDCGKQKSYDAIRCKSCSCIEKMKGKRKRPEFDTLKETFKNNGGNFLATGRTYSVSDNAIRKWIDFYEKRGKSFDSVV